MLRLRHGLAVRRWFPVLEWLPSYRRADLAGDVMAGLTGAAILVPQSMAYAQIAQLPPVVGLYASVVPLLVYAIFGRSRQLSVGPLASISILSAVGVAKLAPTGTARFVALAATLALLVGIVHISIGVLRLGFVMRFLSEPVMTGFLAAVGILLMATQLGPLTGVSVPNSSRAYEIVADWFDVADGTSVATLVLGISCIAALLALRRHRRFPSALTLVIAATAVSAIADFSTHGIAVVGSVPSGLAGPEAPLWHWHDVGVLLPTAFAITLISVLESLALGREYADVHGYELDTNQEIVALGASNVAAGFFQGMIVTGAITRSSILEAAGARSQLSGALSALVVAPLLLFGTGLFRDIPIAVLSAIVVVAVMPFVKVGEARRLWRVQRADFWVLMLSFVGTLALGLELGVLVAVVVSIVIIVYRVTRPHIPEIGRIPGTDYFLELGRHPDARTYPGIVILRPDASLYFTNAETVGARLRPLESRRTDLHTVVLDASGVDHLDATADHELRKIATRYRERDIGLILVNVADGVRAVLDASGFTDIVGPDAFFATDADAIAHLERVRRTG
ncbi:MAG TPA: sulfate permease [Acidimicrobiia bacterium]|nr:sulfate permease [Acidimicrobiia bacterium]